MSNSDSGFTNKGIHKYVRRYIRSLPDLTGKTVLDVPCGDGRSTYEFVRKGASVTPVDLFPEFLKVEGVSATYGDMAQSLPVADGSMDYIICQEGIEHMPNQVHVFEEFNRVLKTGGRLILTTPNYSHLRSRVSQLLFETDFWKRMPPSELDSIWFADSDNSDLYFGHLFLIGVQKLLTISKICGFNLVDNVRADRGSTSMLFGILWPLLWLTSRLTARSYRKKISSVDTSARKAYAKERIDLNLHPNTLFCKHTFWVLEKHETVAEARATLRKKMREQ
ncbi:MAG: class I SAM-dependent methyltransferase [Pseudomonadota bacterium]